MQPSFQGDIPIQNSNLEDDRTFHRIPAVDPDAAVADEEEAIAVAIDSDYGLSASIHAEDKGLAIAQRLHTDCAAVNDFCGLAYGASEGYFGGRKDTGAGFVNGELGPRRFCHAQHIVAHKFVGKRERSR